MLSSLLSVAIAAVSAMAVGAQPSSSAVTAPQGSPMVNYSDPMVGAIDDNFEVVTDPTAVTKFICEDLGARCVFRRLSYAKIDFGTGQDTENEQGAVWAATKPDAVLTLSTCLSSNNINGYDDNHCVVTCNANCTCAYETDDMVSGKPQLCNKMTTRVPTPSPKTEAPVPKVCPEQQFVKEFCPTLMQTALPEGNIENYDCFNFCGGIWISTCDVATGKCGPVDCDNKTATGTLNGIVKGCTIEQYQAKSPTTTNSLSNLNAKSGGTRQQNSYHNSFLFVMVSVIVSAMSTI
jgi:hypothetical protein